ncbi:MAG: protein-L-isoaspartate(D-aspartate) O-methyltransferase [Thermodesulfobacteriota bacterium]
MKGRKTGRENSAGGLRPRARRACLGVALVFLVLAVSAASAGEPPSLTLARENMVVRQIESRGVKDKAVLAALRKIPRHQFVGQGYQDSAYDDRPLPIGYGQTISQPYIVAFMTEILKLTGRERVLEIGTGSGYQAAVLAETAREVYSMEIIRELCEQAGERLTRLGYGRVNLKTGDGYYGWPDKAPFDGIIVTCAADHIPPPLIKQLKPGGRMVIPVGPAWQVQNLILAELEADGSLKRQSLMAVRFVPLTGSR